MVYEAHREAISIQHKAKDTEEKLQQEIKKKDGIIELQGKEIEYLQAYVNNMEGKMSEAKQFFQTRRIIKMSDNKKIEIVYDQDKEQNDNMEQSPDSP